MLGIVSEVDKLEQYAIVTDSEGTQHLVDAILSFIEAGQAIEFEHSAESQIDTRIIIINKIL